MRGTPLSPAADLRAPDMVLLVDGVRRIDARIWVEEPDGTLHAGLAASYAAGVVRCDLRRGRADVANARVARGFFTPSADAADLVAANARYPVHRVAGERSGAAHRGRAAAPARARGRGVARAGPSHRTPSTHAGIDDLLVLDGPLRGRAQLPRALGYVKTHRVQYLPPDLSTVVGRLATRPAHPGVPARHHVAPLHAGTCKLPGPAGSPWAGVVRVETSADLPRAEAIRLADLSAVTLPRFASSPYKDARAPQNLTPIAGLERRLRGMLGDQRLLLRALTPPRARRRAASGRRR